LSRKPTWDTRDQLFEPSQLEEHDHLQFYGRRPIPIGWIERLTLDRFANRREPDPLTYDFGWTEMLWW